MKQVFIRFLSFVNLLDQNEKLSLTNLALVVLVAKVCTMATIDLAAMGALITTFANYMHKRSHISGASDEDEKSQEAIVQKQINEQKQTIQDLSAKFQEVKETIRNIDLSKLRPR